MPLLVPFLAACRRLAGGLLSWSLLLAAGSVAAQHPAARPRPGLAQAALTFTTSDSVRLFVKIAGRGEPWQSGKAILAAAGSRSLKMSDVFKSKKNWRLLIESDGRGAYRLLGR